jgi:putative endonuclease
VTGPGWQVYLLRCADGSLYAGATNDLPRRLAAHLRGDGARYTRSRLPVALVFREGARDRSEALRREAALKRLSRAQKLVLIAAAGERRGRRMSLPRSERGDRGDASSRREAGASECLPAQAVPGETPGSGGAPSGACAPGGASMGRRRSKK